MNFLNGILGGKENNPKELFLQEIEKSEDFFKLLSEALKEPSFQNDSSLNDLKNNVKQYIHNCNIKQLKTLVDILRKNNKY